jgi:hypothetical protein
VDDERIVNTPDYLESKAFQWIGSPEDEIENILDWVDAVRSHPASLGLIDWAAATRDGIEPVADYAWNINHTTN